MVLVLACAKEPDPFVIAARAPLGESPFAGTPAVASVELRVRDTAGSEKTVARVPLGSGSLELPDSAKTGAGSLVLAGLGADGALLAYGRTPPIDLSALTDPPAITVAVLVQRIGTAPPAITLAGAPIRPACATIGARYMVVADGTNADVVDLVSLVARRETPFSAAPATLAATGALTLAIDDAGNATLLDVEAGTSTTPTAPSGTSFAEVAGGAAIADDTGVWLVGPTRMTNPTDRVMRLGSDGTWTAYRLARPRSGAGATWVSGRGLLVAYGSTTSGEALGLELLSAGASAPSSLAHPGEAGPCGVLTALDGNRVLRIAPDGNGTILDLSCAKDCVPAASAIHAAAATPHADDHATRAEIGTVIVRSGSVSWLASDASKLVPLLDAGAQPICSAALSTGAVGIAVGGERALRTFSPPR